ALAGGERGGEGQPGALRLARSLRHAENFPGPDLHDARVDRHRGLGRLFAEAAEPDSSETELSPAHAELLVVAPELGDGPDDDGVHAEQPAELRRGRSVRSPVLLEVLLVQDAVDL